MKKFLLILLLLPITAMSQQGFTRLEVTVKPGHQSAVVNLVDDFFSEAKWKENSGMNLERHWQGCLLYTSPSPRDKRQSRMPSSA